MTNFEWVAAAVLATLATARIIRLAIWDVFPPAQWVRAKWTLYAPTGWVPLMTCGYCFGVYPAIGNVLWGYFADFPVSWWIFNSIAALAYAAPIVVTFDGELVDD